MADFIEKEALIELMQMAVARISRTSPTHEDFKNNLDVKKLSQLIKEVVSIDYKELNFEYYK